MEKKRRTNIISHNNNNILSHANAKFQKSIVVLTYEEENENPTLSLTLSTQSSKFQSNSKEDLQVNDLTYKELSSVFNELVGVYNKLKKKYISTKKEFVSFK